MTIISAKNYDTALTLNENSGFLRHNGIQVLSAEAEHAVLKASIAAESKNIWGNVHGGLIYTLADNAAGAMARAENRKNVTLNASISYLRPAVDVDELYAYGSAVKVGPPVFIRLILKQSTMWKWLLHRPRCFFSKNNCK